MRLKQLLAQDLQTRPAGSPAHGFKLLRLVDRQGVGNPRAKLYQEGSGKWAQILRIMSPSITFGAMEWLRRCDINYQLPLKAFHERVKSPQFVDRKTRKTLNLLARDWFALNSDKSPRDLVADQLRAQFREYDAALRYPSDYFTHSVRTSKSVRAPLTLFLYPEVALQLVQARYRALQGSLQRDFSHIWEDFAYHLERYPFIRVLGPHDAFYGDGGNSYDWRQSYPLHIDLEYGTPTVDHILPDVVRAILDNLVRDMEVTSKAGWEGYGGRNTWELVSRRDAAANPSLYGTVPVPGIPEGLLFQLYGDVEVKIEMDMGIVPYGGGTAFEVAVSMDVPTSSCHRCP